MTVTADASAPAPPELAASGLTVRFGTLTALDGVSLAVRAGECVAIAGEYGAGKTTLLRALGGDLAPDAGTIELDGRPLAPDPVAAARRGVRIVWQDLALADNLDIGANIMLGNERRRHLLSPVRLHTETAGLLERLGIPITDTTRPVHSLTGGQRQMVAVARAMARAPRVLLLDEPTSALGAADSALVERLITRLRAQDTTIVLCGHDIGQMFRLADRIVVLRHGRLVADVSPSEVHPDDVAALVSGQKVDSSARRQLTRLHHLAGRLVTSDPSSSLSLILSALGAAIGSERLAIHLAEGKADGKTADAETADGRAADAETELHLAASLGVPDPLLEAWGRLPADAAGGPAGLAAITRNPVVEDNIPARPGSWARFGGLARSAKIASSWSVPVLGPDGLLGVITVFRSVTGKPRRDDLDLATLYAGYAASAIDRDRLLEEVTARNRVLEAALAAQEEATALRRARDMQHAFLRRLSHELRTPLTAITGYATSLLQPDVTWDEGTRQRFLSRIAAESSRLGRLVNDLLDFSAIESGIFRLNCDWCDLPLVIDTAVAVLPPEQAPLVEVTAPAAVPAVWADHDRLEQVFVNLLANALGHNPPGTRVRVTAAPGQDAVTVLVADDGGGMPPELLLSDPPPAGQSRPRGDGAGLGLSIARGIIAAHGGTLQLEPGTRGTCLRITLPIETPPVEGAKGTE